jgi:hypothetical protein
VAGSKTERAYNDGVSRRRAITALLAMGVCAVDSSVHIAHQATLKPPPKTPALDRPIRYKEVEFTGLITEHDQSTLLRFGPQIAAATRLFNYVVPEYFPPEYSGNDLGDEMGRELGGDWNNPLFRFLAKQFANYRQNVWVLDPAYNGDYGIFRAETSLGISVPIGLMACKNLKQGYTSKPMDLAPRLTDMKRRRFIKVASIMVGFPSLEGYLDDGIGSIGEIEDCMREAVAAEHLKHLTDTGRFPAGAKVVIVTRQAHWAGASQHIGIKKFFEDDALRAKVMRACAPVLAEIPALAKARHYPKGVYVTNRETVAIAISSLQRSYSCGEIGS